MLMNDVCWYGKQGPATNSFTTMDRGIAVEVMVPSSYEGAYQWANEFSDAVARAIPAEMEPGVTGCG
jgi:hypothetical protein